VSPTSGSSKYVAESPVGGANRPQFFLGHASKQPGERALVVDAPAVTRHRFSPSTTAASTGCDRLGDDEEVLFDMFARDRHVE
jgi:hypothetical protein